jgi:hypothetical protein
MGRRARLGCGGAREAAPKCPKEAVHSSAYGTFQPLDNSGLPRRGVLRQVRCLRCGGPVFLNEVARPVAQAPSIFEQPHHRSCSKRLRLLVG